MEQTSELPQPELQPPLDPPQPSDSPQAEVIQPQLPSDHHGATRGLPDNGEAISDFEHHATIRHYY